MRRQRMEEKNKKKKSIYKWCGMAATAACVGILLFAGHNTWNITNRTNQDTEKVAQSSTSKESEESKTENNTLLAETYDTSYDELYNYFKKQERESYVYSSAKGEMVMEDTYSVAETESAQEAETPQDYADTNKQEAGVDEADIIKNDGRYLYQLVEEQDGTESLQIADTKGGLKELTRIKGMDNPREFYVWNDTLVIIESCWADEEDGTYSDKTNIIRIAYEKGIFHKEAEGSVKGILLDDMAINEANGYLRMAVTVDSYKKERVRDDIFGYFMGYETTDNVQDNSVYVLDKNLEIVGKIEGLAENEEIYSARFMGDMGYFVTFRQTDPLFSVDLSDPKNPRILGELKISGFSQYLHFYSENLLLGIGMEADENTGRTQGMKLSMFDISNPADVKEQDKYDLSEYDTSAALYDYKAVMIDTNKNLFGFFARSYNSDTDEKQDFLLFSYENGGFQQKMKIACDTQNETYGYCNVRGTYIGDVFYLLYGDGRIEAYNLTDGSMVDAINKKTE